MKKVLLLTAVMMLGASLAVAQPGYVGVYGDAGGTNCNVVDAAPGLMVAYVVHTLTPGATSVEYSAPVPSCFLGVYLSDATTFPVNIGNSQTGISTAYGACLPGPIEVLDINLFMQALTGPCCLWPVLPHPINGLNMTDCTLPTPVKYPVGALVGTINGNATCSCDAVPTENSSWGAVKSLYNNQ